MPVLAVAGVLGLAAPGVSASTVPLWGAYAQGGIDNNGCRTLDGGINFPVDNNSTCFFDGTSPSGIYGNYYRTPVPSASGSISGTGGSASASADLNAGTLAAAVSAPSATPGGASPAGATAGIFDNVTFSGVNGGSVTVTMNVTGSASGDAQALASLLLQQGPLDGGYYFYPATVTGPSVTFTLGGVQDGTDYAFIALVSATAASTSFNAGTASVSADSITFDLPSGATMTTNQLLTSPAGVPEPRTIALLGIGLVAADVVRRKLHPTRS